MVNFSVGFIWLYVKFLLLFYLHLSLSVLEIFISFSLWFHRRRLRWSKWMDGRGASLENNIRRKVNSFQYNILFEILQTMEFTQQQQMHRMQKICTKNRTITITMKILMFNTPYTCAMICLLCLWERLSLREYGKFQC